MCKGAAIARRFMIILGLFVLTTTAEKLPPPAEEECLATELASKQALLAGKIIKVKFNRIEQVRKSIDGTYTGTLFSSVKPKGDTYFSGAGLHIRFPQEGLGFFLKRCPPPGVDDVIAELTKPDREEVYIEVSRNSETGSLATGDLYQKAGDEGAYKWSRETEIPDLSSEKKISVNDVLLYPAQLNGKIIEVEFYSVDRIKQESAEESVAAISCGRGHSFALITFPTASLAFFKEIENRTTRSRACSVYVKVVSTRGVIRLKALGRRVSGSGDEAEYGW
ncbi:MAG: hypothetical protein IT583_01910 [Verrucomicrobia bacterium]|nr:hypothetical protein [Verrucomicrobiota bacterium]